ncbi:MAG: DUF5615 family PIN-like protein [Deltaproteobacteria bacterium]|nr:DUF5615 family PIN-like protein [Deltaproteobacteria bacterium]
MKLQDVKILADENISPKVVAFLRSAGLDVLDVKEQSWHPWTRFLGDSLIGDWAGRRPAQPYRVGINPAAAFGACTDSRRPLSHALCAMRHAHCANSQQFPLAFCL